MSLAVMSALSLICLDAAATARTPPPAPPAEATMAAAPAVMAAATAQAEESAPETALETTAPETTKVDAGPEPLPEAQDLAVEGVAGSLLVFAEKSDEAVADKLINYIETIDTLQGDFTQVAPSGAVSEGRFYLRRPGLLRFEYEPPQPLLIVANGGMVYVHDDALDTTDSYPVGKTPLKFLLGKKIDREDAKIVAVDRGVDNVAVTFSSEDEETEGDLTLIASAPDLVLRRWIVRDLQGGITVVTLDNIVAGERIANRLFAAPEAGGRFLDR